MGNESSKGSNSPRYQQQGPSRSRIDPSAEAINYARERANEIIRQQRNNFGLSPQPAQTQHAPSTARQHSFDFRPPPQPTQQHTFDLRPPPQPAQTQPAPTQPASSTARQHTFDFRPPPQPAQTQPAPTQPAPSTPRQHPFEFRPPPQPVQTQPAPTQPAPSTASSNLERERNPYSFTRQQLSNPSEKKTTLYPDLSQCSPNSQNSDVIRNGYVFVNSSLNEVNNSPGRDSKPATHSQPLSLLPSAPSEPLLNDRQGRGAIPKQRARSSQFNSDIYKCRTCKRIFGTDIFQCQNGHSSCGNCKQTNRQCGDCRCNITETRNYALQDLLTDMGMKPTAPIFETCPNSKAGCSLRFKPSEVQDHLKECPFQDMTCPVDNITKRCDWVGKQKDINTHFEECHPEHLQGDVNKELYLSNIVNDDRLLYLIRIGSFNFLVHIKVCAREKNVYMVAQFLGTKFSAQKWSFELHIYNKREPRRKYLYNDICRAMNESVEDIFRVNDCAILPLAYAMSFVNEGCIAFKFFIRKKNDDDDESGRRERSRARSNARSSNWRIRQ